MDKELKDSVINRLSNFQMSIKGLSVAVLTASIFADNGSSIKMLAVSFILFSLWMLDAYYLKVERSFRKKDEKEDYGDRNLKNETIFKNMFSSSVLIFHVSFFVVSLVFVLNSFFKFIN